MNWSTLRLEESADVDAEPFLGDPPSDGRTQERFGGVVDVPALERLGESAGSGAQVGLVHDVRRCSHLVGDLVHAKAGHREHAVLVLLHTATPKGRE